jgi:hypothetical protein
MIEVIDALSRAPYKTKWSDMPTDVRAAIDVSRLLDFYSAPDLPASLVLHHIRMLRSEYK